MHRLGIRFCASLMLVYSPFAYTAIPEQAAFIAQSDDSTRSPQDTYTINFNNVSIIELIRFASKLTGLNFIFEEQDLQFSVTVVSEEPIPAKSVMSVLSQVLRMHNLNLLEQEGNVLITTSNKVNQIPTIVSADLPPPQTHNAALITRIFRIKNANVNSVARIIKPMVSETALIEVSDETRQLIVTDITTNIDQIGALLSSLDAPHTSLEVESYKIRHAQPAELILLAQQILTPFTEGNPLLLVPQINASTIYIVSTPYLIDRAMTLLEDLDTPSAAHNGNLAEEEAGAPLIPQDRSAFFIYHPLNRPGAELEQELLNLGKSLKESGLTDNNFLLTLESTRWAPATNSLVFTGDAQSLQKIQVILQSMDVAKSMAPGTKGFFLYKLQHASCEQVAADLKKLAEKISSAAGESANVVSSIENIECVPSSNALLISGTTDAIEQIKVLISEFDVQTTSASPSREASFFVYKPKFLSAQELESSLATIIEDLTGSGLKDPDLLQAITSMHYVEKSQSLVFTGAPSALSKIQQLILQVDTQAETASAIEVIDDVTFMLYKIRFVPETELVNTLKSFALQLDPSHPGNKQIIETLSHVKWIKESNALLFTGTKTTLEKVENLLGKFDTSSGASEAPVIRNASTFVLYTPRYVKGPELVLILQDFMSNLQQSGVTDPGLYDAIKNLKWLDKTSCLLISGQTESIEEVQQLLTKFDVPSKDVTPPTIESIDNTSFLVYKLQYHPGNDIQTALKEVALSMKSAKNTAPELVDAINSLQWVQITNSLLCTGHQDVLVRLKELIENLDTPLRQVFIEVLIINTTLENQQTFGLMWGGQMKYLNRTLLQSGNFPQVSSGNTNNPGPSSIPTTANPTFYNNLQNVNGSTPLNTASTNIPFSVGFDLGVIGDIIMHKGKSFLSLGSLLNAIQFDKDSTVILNPKLVAQDNRQSTIFVGQNVPFTGSLVTTNSSAANSISNVANIEYRDIGVSLTITPMLGEQDIITLDVVQDISQLTQGGNVTTSATQINGIQTSHTHMETRVHVPDNHFVALSGMINDIKDNYKSGVPCLGGLPIIGALFSETDRNDSKDNIIIFIRPQIIKTYQEYKAITEHQEWLFKDQAKLPLLKEEFDDGIDLIKLPENE